MALVSGTRLGPYVIHSVIGSGGMGQVYRASDTALRRDVAVKILHEPFALDADHLARFQREARILASLNGHLADACYSERQGRPDSYGLARPRRSPIDVAQPLATPPELYGLYFHG